MSNTTPLPATTINGLTMPMVYIPVQLTPEFCASVFTTALEGGVQHWAIVTKYRWCDENDNDLPYDQWVAHLTDCQDDAHYIVTLETIAKGIRRLLAGEVRGLDTAVTLKMLLTDVADLVSMPDAGGNMDSSDADNVVQAGLFDTIAYC